MYQDHLDSSDSISVCGVTLTESLSCPQTLPSNLLDVKILQLSHSSPNITEYLENLSKSTNWKDIAEDLKHSKSLDSLALDSTSYDSITQDSIVQDSIVHDSIALGSISLYPLVCVDPKIEKKKQKFKGIINKTIKSRNFIRKITFAVEEAKEDEKKHKRKYKSPPPQVSSDEDYDELMEVEEAKQVVDANI